MRAFKTETVRPKVSPGVTADGLITALILLMLALANIVNSNALQAVSSLRYVAYAVPLLIALQWMAFPTARLQVSPAPYFAVAALYSVLLLPLSITGAPGFKYLVFMGLGFLPFLFPIKVSLRHINAFIVVISAYQVILLTQTGFEIRSFDIEGFASGSAAVTHTLPGIFGILFGYTIATRQYKFAVWCAIMILLSGKRGVLIAALIAAAPTFFMFHPRYYANNRGIILISLISGFCICMMMPYLFTVFAERFGLNINVLTSGRFLGQEAAYTSLYNASPLDLIFGQGLGRADEYAFEGFLGLATLIHSDYLRVLVDLGVFGSAIFCYAYLYLVGRGRVGVYFILFSCVLWVTENNAINISIPIVMYFCQQAYLSAGKINGSRKRQLVTRSAVRS